MQLLSVLDTSSSSSSSPSTQQTNAASSPFSSYFLQASGSSTNTVSSKDAAGEKALEEFMRYAKETPEQRFFDSWLQSEGISEQQYNAMSTAEQTALQRKFEVQEEEQLKNKAIGTLL